MMYRRSRLLLWRHNKSPIASQLPSKFWASCSTARAQPNRPLSYNYYKRTFFFIFKHNFVKLEVIKRAPLRSEARVCELMNTWPPIMSIGRANDWFRVSGFTLAIDDCSLCPGKIEKWFDKVCTATRARQLEVIFCPRQFIFGRKVHTCYVPALLTEIGVFSGGTKTINLFVFSVGGQVWYRRCRRHLQRSLRQRTMKVNGWKSLW